MRVSVLLVALPRLVALIGLVALVGLVGGCNESYRVGDRVWVRWEERRYPAYIIERKGQTRFRVHYEGYPERWDEDVTLERVEGRVQGEVTAPPPPEKVARSMGLTKQSDGADKGRRLYAVGDRVRVRWRRAIYSATVIGLADAGPGYRVHYDGHESAWDETVAPDRIVGRR